jgi:glycosyltransferase involved in cell wall biosynthesis
MKIFNLSAAAIPSRTANSLQAMKMSGALAALGHDVTLFHLAGSDAAAGLDVHAYYGVEPTFEMVCCRWPPVRVAGSLWYAREVVKRVEARGLPDRLYGRHIASLALAARCGRPLVAEVHLPPAHALQRFTLQRVFRSRTFDRLLVISDALREEYTRQFPELRAARVVVARSAADPAAGGHGIGPTGGRPSVPRVGYVGHLYPGKGLETISALADGMPHVDFHVIGGTERDLDRWRRRPSRPNLLLHGHVPPGDLAGWFRSFPIALAPYQGRVEISGGGDAGRWMSPLKLFEYMAYGLAIVASDLPAIREVIRHGSTGLLCQPGDTASWVLAVQRLIDDPGLVRSLGDNARAIFEAGHTWHRRARLVFD